MAEDSFFQSYDSLVDKKKKIAFCEILSILHLNGSSSIASIAQELHTSIPSATALLNELVEEKWVEIKAATKTKTGRRPVYYDLNASKKTILVLDISIVQTNFVFINLRNEILTSTVFEFDLENSAFQTEIMKEFSNLIKLNGAPWAIGISAPGMRDYHTDYNYSYKNLSKDGIPFGQIISEKFNIPVFNINDTRASLIGEHHYGLARNKRNVLLVNVDWGVGMSILNNNAIVRGDQGFAGEIGHIQVNPNGKLCHCGKIGCLETVASATAILSHAQEGLNTGAPTSLTALKRPLKVKDVIKAAQNGDAFCTDIIMNIGHELGKGLAIAVHLFNPEIIIIEGSMRDAGEILLNTIKQSIHKLCLSPFKENLQILVSPLGDTAKIYGTQSYVFQKMMEFYQN
jgi:N-acetylglucosamine repressor